MFSTQTNARSLGTVIHILIRSSLLGFYVCFKTTRLVPVDMYLLLGYAHFPEILQNFSERPILWSLCSIVFYAFILKLSIQTSLLFVGKTFHDIKQN